MLVDNVGVYANTGELDEAAHVSRPKERAKVFDAVRRNVPRQLLAPANPFVISAPIFNQSVRFEGFVIVDRLHNHHHQQTLVADEIFLHTSNLIGLD